MNLYLVRHGQSYGNVDPSVYKTNLDSEIRITELGEAQAKIAGEDIAKRVGEHFTIVHSPFIRAKETAAIIDTQCVLHGKYATMIESPLLYERSWGDLRDIIDTTDFDPTVHFDFFYRPASGESFADTYVRVCAFMQEVKSRRYEHDDLVIVGHGEWISLALMYLRGYSVEYYTKKHIAHTVKNCQIICEKFA